MKTQQQSIAVIGMVSVYPGASSLRELREEYEWLGRPAI